MHLTIDDILNITVARDDDFNVKLRSLILSLNDQKLNQISDYYDVVRIFYDHKICSICNLKYKIWNTENNYGYSGCIYNPIYYCVILLNDIKDYHKMGHGKSFNG